MYSKLTNYVNIKKAGIEKGKGRGKGEERKRRKQKRVRKKKRKKEDSLYSMPF